MPHPTPPPARSFRLLPLVTAAALTATAHGQSMPLGAQEAARRAATDNPLVKARMAQGDAAGAHVDEARSGFFPTLSVDGTYTYLDPINHVGFELPNGTVQDLAFQPHDNYEARARVSYLAWDMGQRNSALHAAQAGQQMTGHQLEQLRNDLAYRALQQYFGVLALEQAMAVQQRSIDALRENLRRVEARIAQQSATGYDELVMETRISEAQRDLIRSRQQHDEQLAALRQLLDLPVGTALTLTDTASNVARPVIDTSAWRRRPDHAAALDRLAQTQAQLELDRRRGLPSLSVFAQGGVKNGYQPQLNEGVANWAAGADLSVPIFQGGRKVALVEGSRAHVQEAEFEVAASEAKIKAELDQARVRMEAALQELETTDALVSQAEETVKRTRVRYDNGLATALELMDAEVANSRAGLARTQARYDLAIATYGLSYTAGIPLYP